jgi:hypothetical protein
MQTVAGDAQRLLERWDGRRWSIVNTPAPSGTTVTFFANVACATTTDCTIVGYQGSSPRSTLIEHWNGNTWSVVPSPTVAATMTYLSGVACPSTTFCIAVGWSGDIDEQRITEVWDGHVWSIASTPAPAGDSLLFVMCTAVGSGSVQGAEPPRFALTWSSGRWREHATPSPPNVDESQPDGLIRVACSTMSACAAVGSYSTGAPDYRRRPMVDGWNGISWTSEPIVQPSNEGALLGAACLSATVCFVVGWESPTPGTATTLIEQSS